MESIVHLWIGAFLAWLAGMPQLCWAIVVVILINGVFSYWQEYQAERAAEALQALLPQQVMVRREGEEQLIPASEVVPGDILLLAEGAAIPADARVLVAERLRVDMSSLTGESKAVSRTADEAKTVLTVSTAGFRMWSSPVRASSVGVAKQSYLPLEQTLSSEELHK